MLILLLFFALIILGIIFVPQILQHRAQQETADIGTRYHLSALETSVFRDLRRAQPTTPLNHLLYLLCLKPIRPETKREIARDIIDDFPNESEAYFNLWQLMRPPAVPRPPERADRDRAQRQIDRLDQLYRATQQTQVAPTTPSKQPQRPQTRHAPALSAPSPSPPLLPINPFEVDFDVFDFLNHREFRQQMDAFTDFEQQLLQRRAKHVYDNSENVHALNSDCLTKAYNLVEKYRARATHREIEKEISLLLLNAPVGKTEAIATTLERVRSDKSNYGYDAATFTLSQLFYSVVMYIKLEAAEDSRIELQQRLYEELEEASKKCGTGHVVRLMNVLQGFDTDYAMRLSVADEIYARLSILARKAIEQSADVDEILDDNERLVAFLHTQKAHLTSLLVEEYKDILEKAEIETHVRDALNKYTKTKVF